MLLLSRDSNYENAQYIQHGQEKRLQDEQIRSLMSPNGKRANKKKIKPI